MLLRENPVVDEIVAVGFSESFWAGRKILLEEEVLVSGQENRGLHVEECAPPSPSWGGGTGGLGVCLGLFTGGFHPVGLSKGGLYGLEDP